jgi:hypothetical protein
MRLLPATFAGDFGTMTTAVWSTWIIAIAVYDNGSISVNPEAIVERKRRREDID